MLLNDPAALFCVRGRPLPPAWRCCSTTHRDDNAKGKCPDTLRLRLQQPLAVHTEKSARTAMRYDDRKIPESHHPKVIPSCVRHLEGQPDRKKEEINAHDSAPKRA